jgi:hypothetical protein
LKCSSLPNFRHVPNYQQRQVIRLRGF